MTVNINGLTLNVEFHQYRNGRPAIELTEANGEPYMTATINFPELEIPNKYVAIKNYGGQENVEAALREAGIIGKVVTHVQGGHIKVPVCELLINPNE